MHIEVTSSRLPFIGQTIVEGHKTSSPSSPLPPPFIRYQNVTRDLDQTSASVPTSRSLDELANVASASQLRTLQEQGEFNETHRRVSTLGAGGGAATGAALVGLGGTLCFTPAFLIGPPVMSLGAAAIAVSSAVAAREHTQYGKAAGRGAIGHTRFQMAAERAGMNTVVARAGLRPAIEAYAENHARYVESVATCKLYSIIMHVLSKESASHPALPAERREAVRELLEDGAKSLFAGTTLLPEELARMRQIFASDTYKIWFFSGNVQDIRFRLANKLSENRDLQELDRVPEFHERVMRKATEQALDDGDNIALKAFLAPRNDGTERGHRRIVTHQEWHRFRATNPGLDQAFKEVHLNEAVRQLKADAKYRLSTYASILGSLSNVRESEGGMPATPETPASPTPEPQTPDA